MTRKQNLIALHNAVEAGKLGNNEPNMPPDFYGYWGPMIAAQFGDLNSAEFLHKALLPGWSWSVWWDANGEATVAVELFAEGSDTLWGTASNFARAWLLAILKALIAKEAEE